MTPICTRFARLVAPLALAASAVSAAHAQETRSGAGSRVAEFLEEVASIVERRENGEAPNSPHHGLQPLSDDDFPPRDEAKETLGRVLFYDKILSGNQNISCATCHHGLAAMGDGLSLSVGEGGRGLGMTRGNGTGADAVHERVPRNAPHVFMLGALEITRMFHDGRVEVDPSQPSGFRSPAGDSLPQGLDSVLAVQAMFPVTSGTEMAGQPGENEIADAAAAGDLPQVWALLAQRLQAIPEYVDLFMDAFDDVQGASDITYAHAANAIAAWEASAFRADDSPFDRFLRGDEKAMSRNARIGMSLFYGPAGCSSCHGGVLQTNQSFKAIAMPQIGPGKGDNLPGYSDGHDDFGRERVTGHAGHRFRFRVPTLRNVALTAPYGHDGAYDTLEAIVRHHFSPVASLNAYDPAQCVLPPRADLDAIDFIAHNDAARRSAIAQRNQLPPRSVPDAWVNRIIDFLHALTDPRSLDLRRTVPMSVPSGLPVFD